MKPLDIWEHKIQWLPHSFDVKVIKEQTDDAISWCKLNCEPWEWDIEKYTHAYAHTFQFEVEVDAVDLEEFLRLKHKEIEWEIDNG